MVTVQRYLKFLTYTNIIFIIIVVSLYIMRKTSKYRLYSPIEDFTIKELRDVCRVLSQYCSIMIGYKKHKGLPTFSVRKDYSGNYYGQYNPPEHKIYLFYNNIDNLGVFVSTFIHEYTHSIQNLRYYTNRLSKTGYMEHPDEIQARSMERLHCKTALKYLRDNI